MLNCGTDSGLSVTNSEPFGRTVFTKDSELYIAPIL